MSWRGLLVAVALTLVAVACDDSTQESPATAPPTTAATTTAPTSTVATTAPASTTTLALTSEEVRLAEIEEIFRDLEYRRLDALYRNDEEAFGSLYSSSGYLQESLQAFGVLEFGEEPNREQIDIQITSVLKDEPDCLAAAIRVDFGSIFPDPADAELTLVLTPHDGKAWGYSFGGSGWLCVGNHPLDA